VDIPYGTDAEDLIPNLEEPALGVLALMRFWSEGDWIYHVAVVEKFLHGDRILVYEGNFKKGKIGTRIVHYKIDPTIIGYWTPQTSLKLANN